LRGLRRRIAIRWARLPRPAPASPAPADFWRAWERLEELEAHAEREETMAQIDELRTAVGRLAAANRALAEALTRVRAHNSDLSGQLAAQPDPAAVQAVIDEATAAAGEAEAALAPPLLEDRPS
jgi:hypothetical protein